MNILLAFLLYKNLSAGELRRLGPFLPLQTRKGINAMLAYDGAEANADSDDTKQDDSFPYLLLKLIYMKEPSQSDLFSLLKSMLPREVAANLPDPETLMNMMNIISAMDLSDLNSDDADTASGCDEPSCDQSGNNEPQDFDAKQRSFFDDVINKQR